MKNKMFNILISFLSSIIVMSSCVLMNYFLTHDISFTSIVCLVISTTLLWGSLNFWENKLKSVFRIKKDK